MYLCLRLLTFYYDVLSKLQGKVCTLTHLHELPRIVAAIMVIYGNMTGGGGGGDDDCNRI